MVLTRDAFERLARIADDELLALRRKIAPKEHHVLADTLRHEARALAHRREFAAAEKLVREALGMEEPHHPLVPRINALGFLFNLVRIQGREKEALELNRDLVDFLTRERGPDHPKTLFYRGMRGWMLLRSARDEEGFRLLDGMRHFWPKSLETLEPAASSLRFSYAQALSERDRLEEAETHALGAFEGSLKRGGPGQKELRGIFRFLLGLYEDMDQPEKARALRRRFRSLRSRSDS